MPAFIDTALGFAQRVIRAVFGAVVARGDDECIIGEVIALQRFEDSPKKASPS